MKWLAAAGAIAMAWLAGWIFKLGPVLINDEYAAIDYFYRIVRTGGFYPTPDKLHKPLSIAMGVFAWAFETPLAYELATAAFSAAFIVLLYVAVNSALGRAPALIAALLVAAHPDFMYYSATGSTVMPFSALAFMGLIAVQRRLESDKWLWVYTGCFLAGGLTRPESWLFAAAATVWWSPLGKGRKAWVRYIIAGSIMALAPVIWFGKDLLINGDLMHGINVATRDKAVGTGAPLTVYQTTRLFWTRIPEAISRPWALFGLAGMAIFVKRRGLGRGLLDPMVLYPPIMAGYVWLIVYMGVWHAQRYWYFNGVFLTCFGSWLAVDVIRKIEWPANRLIKAALFFAAAFTAGGMLFAAGGEGPTDLRRLLVGGGALAVAAAAGVLWPDAIFGGLLDLVRRAINRARGKSAGPGPGLGREDGNGGRPALEDSPEGSPGSSSLFDGLVRPAARPLLVGLVTLSFLGYGVMVLVNYRLKVNELTLEAGKQREIELVADYLMKAIPKGREDRIMIPSRRNEQLNWEFREREIPDTFFFREAFYLNYHAGTEFTELHPDWIVYVHKDYQFFGPTDHYRFFQFQDRISLYGIEIELIKDYGETRLFKVTYPPDHPPKGEMPLIPIPGL